MSNVIPAAANKEQVAAPESRVIRVFLSSTFLDFMQERDLLVKQVFPELRRKARERGVEVVDVDLRWGITENRRWPDCFPGLILCRTTSGLRFAVTHPSAAPIQMLHSLDD